MQMMQVDYGQPSYGSATMLGSASAVVYWLLAGSVAYLLIDSQAAPTGSDDGSDTAKV